MPFGTILGRSFSALRQNPRVLLGFALIVQTLAYVVVLAAVAGVAFLSFSRLDTLRPGTDEFDAVFAGSTAITLVVGLVLGLAAGALSVIVQGIVVTEVAHAAVAEKLTLGGLWRQVKPVVWRLIGYALLVILAVVAAVAVVAVAIFSVAVAAGPAAIALTLLVILAAIPLTWWLMVKLLLVPAAIILEHATIGRALARSWTLTRRRFWPTLGVIFLISVVFGFVAQVISVPFSFLSGGLSTIIAPTGATEPSAIIALIVAGLLTQVVTLLIQSVAVVVQATATAIIYIDCRMRHEGLDLDLLAYVERRDAGAADLPDPYRQNVGRVMAPRFVGGYPPAQGYAPGYPAPGYAAPAYAPMGAPAYPMSPTYAQPSAYSPAAVQPPYGQAPAYAQPPYGAPAGQPSYAQTPSGPPAPQPPSAASGSGGPATPPLSPEAAEDAPAATSWRAPGAPADGVDRESPWA
nr:glycerophosphoryl diester phosphodiesterase membrane domain-containing protein [Microbacterium sp. MF43]